MLKRDRNAQCWQDRQHRLFIDLAIEQHTGFLVARLTERILVNISTIVEI